MKDDSPSIRNDRFARAVLRLANRELSKEQCKGREFDRWMAIHGLAVQTLNYRALPMNLKMAMHEPPITDIMEV